MKKVQMTTGVVNENGTINVNKSDITKVKAAACEKYGLQPFEHVVTIGGVGIKFVWDTRKATGVVDTKAIDAGDLVKQVRDKGEAIDVSALPAETQAKLKPITEKITANYKSEVAAAEKKAAEEKAAAENQAKAEANQTAEATA